MHTDRTQPQLSGAKWPARPVEPVHDQDRMTNAALRFAQLMRDHQHVGFKS